jgi:hypothetical protein
MSIFEGFLSTSETLDAFSDRAFVDAMLRFEAALARAQAAEGLIPESAAHSIVGSCKVELFDVAKIVRESGRAGSVAIPLVKALREAVGLFNAEAAPFVHFGSTSQDVIDSAMALVTREAVTLIAADLSKAVSALLRLAVQHAETPMLARTLMQPASVTSFGFKCAGWAAPLVRSRIRLHNAAKHALKLQLGGAVGTLAQMKGLGAAVRQRMAKELGLRRPRRDVAHAARRMGRARLRARVDHGQPRQGRASTSRCSASTKSRRSPSPASRAAAARRRCRTSATPWRRWSPLPPRIVRRSAWPPCSARCRNSTSARSARGRPSWPNGRSC